MTSYKGIMELIQNLLSRILIRVVRPLLYLAKTADPTQSIRISVLRFAFVGNFIVIYRKFDPSSH
jgi:hypothetical protein